MSSRKPILIYLLFIGVSICSQSQEIVLNGKIIDSVSGESLVGTNVILPNLQGTSTGIDGRFSLVIPSQVNHIEIRFTGYESRMLHINKHGGSPQNILIKLKPRQEMLEQVVVSAGKYEMKLSEITVSMDLLKADYISAINTTSMDQALDKMSGVNIIDGQANIRGGSGYSYGAGSRVLLLVDGLPMLTGDAGSSSWSFVPLENISQVEVIKGASSVLYGSSALNGVINLRTAYPTSTPQTRISFFNGVSAKPQHNITHELDHIQYQIFQGDTIAADSIFKEKAWWGKRLPFESGFSVLHKQKFKQLDFVAGLFSINSESFNQGAFSRRIRGNIATRYHFARYKGLQAGVNANVQQGSSANFFMWNGDGSQTYIPLGNTMTTNYGYKLTLDPFINFQHKNFSQKLQGRWYRNYNYAEKEQSTFSDLLYGEYQAQKQFQKGLRLTGGFTFSYTRVLADLYNQDSITASNRAIYLQADKKFFNRLSISAGGRYEFNRVDSNREAKPVFRIGVNYRAAKATFLRASFGQGYRFPTIAEMFIKTSVGFLNIYPNQTLHSETGWSAELGIKQGIRLDQWNGFVDLAIFQTDYQDMMEFTFGGVDGSLFGFQSVNIGNTQIRGFELTLSGDGKIGSLPLTLHGGYTYLNPKFQVFDSVSAQNSSADYNVLKYRFRHTLKLDAQSQLDQWTFGITARYFSYMEAVDKILVVFIPGVADFRSANEGKGDWILDARIARQFNERTKISLLINNFLNNEYSLRPGLAEAPRSIAIRLDVGL